MCLIRRSAKPWRAAALLLAAAGLTSARTVSSNSLQESTAVALVRAYDGGSLLSSAETETLNWRRFVLSFERDVQLWIDGGASGPEKRHRSQVAAAAALEIASTGLSGHWSDASILVEAGCKLIRSGQFPPDPIEQAWHAAAIALIEGARDDRFLVAEEQPGSFLERTRHGAFNHLDHVSKRFPNDPIVAFVRALVAERTTFPDPPRTEPWVADLTPLRSAKEAVDFARASGRNLPDPTTLRKAREYDRRARMVAAINMFMSLRERPPFQAEAALRAGKLLSRLQRFGEALSLLSEVRAQSTDPALIHLALVFAGEIMEATGRPEQAIRAYRDALATRPRAQTASLRLAALLLSSGGLTEATALVADSTGPDGRSEDPWKTYGSGTYRRWPELLAELRSRLGRRSQ